MVLRERRPHGRLEILLFHPLYDVSEHFFQVGADVFEFHVLKISGSCELSAAQKPSIRRKDSNHTGKQLDNRVSCI